MVSGHSLFLLNKRYHNKKNFRTMSVFYSYSADRLPLELDLCSQS